MEFKDLAVTTMVVVVEFSGEIYYPYIFPLLPIYRIELIAPVKELKKMKLPFPGFRGAITSVKYADSVRGIVKSDKGAFRHSTTVDISTDTKNVNVKVYKTKLQFSGAKSMEDVTCGTECLLKHIKDIQESLDFMRENLARAEELVNELQESCRGRIDLTPVLLPSGDIGYLLRNFVQLPPQERRNEVDSRLLEFFLASLQDFVYVTDFIKHLRWLLTLERVYDGSLEVTKIRSEMVNYSYMLGFNLDRQRFAECMREANFQVAYINTYRHHVKVRIPYRGTDKNGNPKMKRHSFTVHRHGLVGQSGPDETRNKEAYETFMAAVNKVRHLIEA